MKKVLLTLATTFFPNISFSAACKDGENPAACTIITGDFDYTLSGDIFKGGAYSAGISLSSADLNTITLIGDVAGRQHQYLLKGILDTPRSLFE